MSRSRDTAPDAVLQHYFDDLLSTSDEAPPTSYADPVEAQRERVQKLLHSAVPVARTRRPAPAEERALAVAPAEVGIAPQVPAEAPVQERLADPEPGDHPFEMAGVEWLNNGRPTWAQKRFDVLLFKVSGLTLAVPLISLGQIQPINDELTPLFGQADWFMGLLPTPGGKIRTVNTAKFVMPERYDDNFVRTAQYVISIDGVPWGLAVDSVNQPISLDPDDVKWRSERSRRPWLAGTVKEHMCALLDIPRVGQLLMQADTRRRA